MLKLKKASSNNQTGFTPIECLLVAAITAILVGIVIIAIHPNKQVATSRNAQRTADVTVILSAIYQYAVDNNTIPPTITARPTEVCATGVLSCNGLTDLTALTTSNKYLMSLPKDPQCSTVCSTSGTGYKVSKDGHNKVIVSAPSAENGESIMAVR